MLLVLLTLSLTDAPAANWPEFRGPHGDGAAAAKNLPVTWSEKENVRWKTPIHDKGWSSPVVWRDQIWLTTAKADGREFFALCVDKSTGKILHDLSLLKVEKPEFCHAFNSYASPTPAIEEGRVYCHFGTYGTFCLDTATGKPVWENRELHCDHYRGPGSSPIIYKNLLILTFDGYDVQFVAALDKRTGQVVWKQDRAIKFSKDDGDWHKGYATPSVLTIHGQPQLVAPCAEATIAYEPETGKELWRITTGGMNQSMRPILAHDLLYLHCGNNGTLLAVKAGTTDVAWKTIREAPVKPSVLVLDERVYMVNDKAVVTCLNAKTGKLIWRERLDGDFTASPVSAGGMIFAPNESGKTFVFEASDSFSLLAANKLDAGCMASPVIADDCLILRTRTDLYCVRK